MGKYTTLSEAINELTLKGYTHNFNIQEDCIICQGNNVQLNPEDFEIDKIIRFQEMSDVDNESILYAISAIHQDLKGLLVNAYGMYANTASAKLVAKLNK